MIYSLALSCLALLPSAAQLDGGDVKTFFRFDGPGPYLEFGHSAASAGDLDGDGFPDILIGASEGNSVYVYSGASGAQLTRLNGTQNRDGFGSSVAGAGDVNADGVPDILVGAPGFDPPGNYSAGGAFVYSGLDYSLLYRFDGQAAFDQLGDVVAGAGDVNGDGYADVLVGTHYGNNGLGVDEGYAVVYSGFDGSLLYRWNESNYVNCDFACSVAGAGDVDADGFDDVIIGSRFANANGLTNPGSAFVYSGQTGAILYRFDGTVDQGRFGYSVAGAGDANRDGHADLLVGATYVAGWVGVDHGEVYLISGVDGSLLHRFVQENSGDSFGISVAGAGDVNADGHDDIIVGAEDADPGGRVSAGAAYVYSGLDGSLLFDWKRSLAFDRTGRVVAAAGDINQDGYDDVMICSPFADPWGATDVGSVNIVGLEPYIRANAHHVSAASATTLDFELDFPDSAAGHDYRVLLSPGLGPTLHGVNIPLSGGPMAIGSWSGSYPFPTTVNMHGSLNAHGQAIASCSAPAGFFSSAIGHTVYFAAVAMPPGGMPAYSSIALPVTIEP